MKPVRTTVDAVILDLDDTLIRETDYVLSGYRAVAQSLADVVGADAAELLARLTEIFESPERSRAFNVLLEPFDRADLVPWCIETYRGHTPDITITPSAEALLLTLLERVKVGVVTDGPLVMQEAKVAALRLRERGLEVVCTDSLGGRETWKPSPAGLVEVLRRLDVSPGRAVYIADNPHKDFLATAGAGVLSIRLRHEGQLHPDCEPQPGAEPEHEIADLADVLTLLDLPAESTSNT